MATFVPAHALLRCIEYAPAPSGSNPADVSETRLLPRPTYVLDGTGTFPKGRFQVSARMPTDGPYRAPIGLGHDTTKSSTLSKVGVSRPGWLRPHSALLQCCSIFYGVGPAFLTAPVGTLAEGPGVSSMRRNVMGAGPLYFCFFQRCHLP